MAVGPAPGGARIRRESYRLRAIPQGGERIPSRLQKAHLPISLLNSLMREQLRVLTKARAKAALRRAAIFPLTTLDSYDLRRLAGRAEGRPSSYVTP